MQKEYSFKFQLFPNWQSLIPEEILLVNKAFEAMEKAYAPYSKFKVGAALLLEDSQIIQGCLLYTSPSPRDRQKSRMPSSA